MTPESCGVDWCAAFSADDDGFCVVHSGAKRVRYVMTGTTCPNCGRKIESGDWITRASTLVEQVYAICPPRRQRGRRNVDRSTPLFEREETDDAEIRSRTGPLGNVGLLATGTDKE